MDSKYTEISLLLSRVLTFRYSTSFSLATRFFPSDIRDAIFALYGFVRIADEIVDTDTPILKEQLIYQYEQQVVEAIETGVSTNPILHAFAHVVRRYNIPLDLIKAFIESMKKDLSVKKYMTEKAIADYIYGSADVVGLMCLRIFCRGENGCYESLQQYARKLGTALQKVNFLRDLWYDTTVLNRLYFPILADGIFTEEKKHRIINEIWDDFSEALIGIRKLPHDVRFPVYIAYILYTALLEKLAKTPLSVLVKCRVRISNCKKIFLVWYAWVRHTLKLV
ncbi:MAG: phytoene/squalene synthase family protein [Bacteroidetes bacterium]|nr:phytoene/squalene synthase family protein [Bacteroidota bacterium]